MLLAALNDGPYNVVYLLHIVSILLGAGAAFLAPIAAVKARNAGVADTFDGVARELVAPGLLAAGVFGAALVGMSSDFYDFGQTWLSIGGFFWIVAVAAGALAFPPSFASFLPDMSDKKPMLSGIMHLSLAIMLILMVWKPGSPF